MLAWALIFSPLAFVFLVVGRELALRLAPKLTLRGQAVLYGALSALVTGAGQVARGRLLAGLFLCLATICVPTVQGIPSVVLTAFIAANPPAGYFDWYEFSRFLWFPIYYLPSYATLWLFGIWDAVRRSESRVPIICVLGLLLNLVVPGLGTVWATAGSGAHLKRKFYWSGALAVLGGLAWWGYGLQIGCVILYHGRFPPFTWYDLFGYPGGVVPGFFPDLAIWGSAAFVLTSFPVFFLEKRKSNAEGEKGEKNVTDQ